MKIFLAFSLLHKLLVRKYYSHKKIYQKSTKKTKYKDFRTQKTMRNLFIKYCFLSIIKILILCFKTYS